MMMMIISDTNFRCNMLTPQLHGISNFRGATWAPPTNLFLLRIKATICLFHGLELCELVTIRVLLYRSVHNKEEIPHSENAPSLNV